MELTHKQFVLAIAGALIVGAGVFYTIGKTGAPGTDAAGKSPDTENPDLKLFIGMSSPLNMLGVDPDGSLSWSSRLLHTFHPIDHVAPDCDYKVYLQHRYPTITGTNVNTLIHHGYSPLMVPSSRDYDWFTRPPGDDEFAGGE